MNARIPRFLRLRSFWLGLPFFLFLLWAWWHSMLHVTALHRQQGAPMTLEWPPPESGMYLRLPEPELQPTPAARFDLEELSSYREAGAAINPPPLQPRAYDPNDHWSLSGGGVHRVQRNEFMPSFHQKIWTYHSAGIHSGALWASSWRSSTQMPEREHHLASTKGEWFPAPEWGATDRMGNRTFRLPYWLLLVAYLAPWTLLMRWRLRRRSHARQLPAALPIHASP